MSEATEFIFHGPCTCPHGEDDHGTKEFGCPVEPYCPCEAWWEERLLDGKERG